MLVSLFGFRFKQGEFEAAMPEEVEVRQMEIEMKIAVLVKRVPDTETKVKIGGDGLSIDPSGVNYALNPYDEFAIEEALKIKEAAGAGEVIVLSVGGAEATKEMRKALAMGADSGVLLKADTAFSDTASIAAALAAKLGEISPDLILCGKQAVDDDNSALPQYLAEKLSMPCASVCVKLEVADGKAKAEREIEGGREVVEMALPAVISCQKGLNEPRPASMKGIMMAKKKPIEEFDVTLDAPKTVVKVMEMPAARPEGKIVGEGPDAVDALITALRDEAKVL